MLKKQKINKSNSSKTLSSSKGFTIVELLVVIVIIGVLAGISLAVYSGVQKRATLATVQSDFSNVGDVLAAYDLENDGYPDATDGGLYDNCPDFAAAGLDDYGFDMSGDNGCGGYDPDTGEYCVYTGEFVGAADFDGYCTPPDIREWYPDYCQYDENGDFNGEGGPTVAASCPHIDIGTEPIDLGQPDSCPAGFIPVPGSMTYKTFGFCVMKYEAQKGNEFSAVESTPNGAPWVSISKDDAILYSGQISDCLADCHLIKESEWMTIAENIFNEHSNWSTGIVGIGSLYTGNSNNAISPSTTANYPQRFFTLSNGEQIWDFAGNAAEWTQGSIACEQIPNYPDTDFDFTETFIIPWYEPSLINKSTLSLNGMEGSIYVPPKLAGDKGMLMSNGIGFMTGYCSRGGNPSMDFTRGGYAINSSDEHPNFSGIYSLHIRDLEPETSINVGFRVAK